MPAFGKASLAELEGVHPRLIEVVSLAIQTTQQDFGVHEGVRSIQTQRQYVGTGVSKTMNSKHLLQPDGFSHAVDLVPYVAGKLRWEWPPIYVVAVAVIAAANQLGVEMVWGGVWDKRARELPTTTTGLKKAVEEYCVRHPGPDFLDGPHWQLVGV